jgi:hypothetical protein
MTRTTTAAALLAGASLALAACGDSSTSETAIEEILEQATGDDADIDLSDGEIKVQTEEGEVQIEFDEEDGSFEMSVDGSQVVDAQVDGESGEINIATDDGEATIDVDEDGEGSMEITGEDGETAIDVNTGSGEIPDDWPSGIPAPEDLAIEGSSTFASGDDIVVSVTGTADADWIENYGATVESAGLSESSRMETQESLNLFYEGNGWVVTIFGTDSGDGQWDVVVSATVMPE